MRNSHKGSSYFNRLHWWHFTERGWLICTPLAAAQAMDECRLVRLASVIEMEREQYIPSSERRRAVLTSVKSESTSFSEGFTPTENSNDSSLAGSCTR